MRPFPPVRALLPVLCLALAACVERPDVAARIDPAALAAPTPALVPLGPLLASAAALGATPVAGPPEGRIAALNARAARLRGPVVDAATRARMAEAARRGAAIRAR